MSFISGSSTTSPSGRPDMLAASVVDVNLVMDRLGGGSRLLLRYSNGLQRGRLEASKPKRRQRQSASNLHELVDIATGCWLNVG